MSSVGPWLGSRRSGFDDTWFGSPFSSDSWDPFDLGVSLIRSVSGGGGGDETSALALAKVDWRETDNAHIFRADLPGVRKEELKVQVEEDNNILEISGERVKEEEDKNDKWHRVERRRGRFVRRFRLPENADLDNVKCGLENGVLTVTVPKKEVGETQKNVRCIDVA